MRANFARVLSKRPDLKNRCASIMVSVVDASEAFGPGEKWGAILFWNFQNVEGDLFTAFMDLEKRPEWVVLCAAKESTEFYGFFLDATAAVAHGERTPTFFGCGGMSIRAEAL
jgi:hypothetical protein